jgi:hypothetical protein
MKRLIPDFFLPYASACGIHGYKTVAVHTVDTNVLVIAISLFSDLNLEQLWMIRGHSRT